MVGTMARGRAARKVPRRTNPDTSPRPRWTAAARFRPQEPCRAPISGVACAISPGNPSLRRSSRPSSPPGPPPDELWASPACGQDFSHSHAINVSLRDSELEPFLPLFNSLYGRASSLFYDEFAELLSEEGSQQGCPLGGLLFVLSVAAIAEDVALRYHGRSIVCKYTLQGGSGRACTRSTPARARTRRPHTTVRLQTPFLTGPSCAASLGGALGCAVGTVWVHLGRRQQMPSGRPAGRGLVTRDHFSVRQFADTSLHPG